jgi:flagellin
MAQVINTNVAALFAGSALNKSALALQTAQQRLSSGLRINSAKDDPTGMVIATGYDSQIRGANQAARNANDGISSAQINDGYHQQILENLQRLREIAVQSGGTIASGNQEAKALVAENTRILALAGNTGSVVVNSNGGTVTGVGTKATLNSTATDTVDDYDKDIKAVTDARASYGADMATFQSAINTLQLQSVNESAAYSRVMDTDYAAETTAMTRNNILQQAGTAVLAQANQTPNTVLTLLR